VGGWIQVVNVQGSRFGGQFAVNLATQPLRIPDVLGGTSDPSVITQELCEFRGRLSAFGTDQWWSHDATTESMDAAVASAAAVYLERGRSILGKLAAPDSPLELVTAANLASGNFNFFSLESTLVRMCLALARLRKVQGRVAESQDFARLGLSNLGRAETLRQSFVDLSGHET
jgi:hypothetical protein